MAQWRVKPLETFPTSFHKAMLAGEGEDKVVSKRLVRSTVQADQVQFQIFRYSIRNGKDSDLKRVEEAYVHRTRIAYNRDQNVWELLLTSREPSSKGMKFLD